MLKSLFAVAAASTGLVVAVPAAPDLLGTARSPDRLVAQAKDTAALLHGRHIFTLTIGALAAGEPLPENAACSSLDEHRPLEGVTACRVYSSGAVHLCYSGGTRGLAQIAYGRGDHAVQRPGCDL